MDGMHLKRFYFNDPRVMYSMDEIEDLVSSGVTPADTVIRITDLSVRAGDIALHKSPILFHLLSLSIDEPA
jgi:hypothetical protein